MYIGKEIEQILKWGKVKEEQQGLQTKIQEIQERIKNGESTGDFITDSCLVLYGLDYRQFEEKFQRLYSKLKEKNNELVLVGGNMIRTINYGEPGVCYFVPPIEIWGFKEVKIGLIQDPFLKLKGNPYLLIGKDDNFEIATGDKKIIGKTNLFDEVMSWEIKKGDIGVEYSDFFSKTHEYKILLVGEDILRNEFRPFSGDYLELLNILIGDSEVKKYFDERKAKSITEEKAEKDYADLLQIIDTIYPHV